MSSHWTGRWTCVCVIVPPLTSLLLPDPPWVLWGLLPGPLFLTQFQDVPQGEERQAWPPTGAWPSGSPRDTRLAVEVCHHGRRPGTDGEVPGLPGFPCRFAHLAWPHPSPELFFFLPASWASPRLPHSLCFCSAVCPDLSLCPAWPLVCVGVQDARQAPACRQTDPTLHDSACCMLKQIGVKSCFPPPLIIPLSAPKASSQLEKNVIFQVPSNFYDAKTPIQQLLYRSSLSTSQWKGSSFHVNPIFFGSSIYEVPEVFKCRRLLPPTHSGTKHGASRIY